MANSIEQEIGRRRTFAIISHPDDQHPGRAVEYNSGSHSQREKRGDPGGLRRYFKIPGGDR